MLDSKGIPVETFRLTRKAGASNIEIIREIYGESVLKGNGKKYKGEFDAANWQRKMSRSHDEDLFETPQHTYCTFVALSVQLLRHFHSTRVRLFHVVYHLSTNLRTLGLTYSIPFSLAHFFGR